MSEQIKFINTTYPNMQLEMYPDQPALYENGRLRQKEIPGKFIKFKDYQYVTNDLEEIEFLRNCPNATGINGVICIKEMSSSSLVRDKILELTNKHGEERVFKLLDQLDKKADEKKAQKKIEPEPVKQQKIVEKAKAANKQKAAELADADDLVEE